MIREEYKQQLIETRENWPGSRGAAEWGSRGHKYIGAQLVEFLNRRTDIKSVLDFGCGIGVLGVYVQDHLDRPVEWNNYDPSMPKYDKEPTRQFDMIVSSDVLEHIEPVSLDETLQWIADHADRTQYHAICCGPTCKTLPDGRDVHLIQEPISWWEDELDRACWTVWEVNKIWQMRKGIKKYRGNIILDRNSRG